MIDAKRLAEIEAHSIDALCDDLGHAELRSAIRDLLAERLRYLIRREPTKADLERVASAVRAAWTRYTIIGTSEAESGYGPPFGPPWLLIDASTSEPEVNWPGEVVGEFANPTEASAELYRIVAHAAWRAASNSPADPAVDQNPDPS